MINKNSPILIAGAGSIGERHIGVLQAIGFQNLWVFRQRNLPMRNIREDSIHIFSDINDLEKIKPVAAIICTPTSHHIDFGIHCAQLGIHLLIEKPLAESNQKTEILEKSIRQYDVVLQVAYMLRYHPFFIKAKNIVQSQSLGRLLSMQTYWGEYLPHWHPWEDYRQSYAARKDLGGGAARTLSHDIDLVNYLAESEVLKWHTQKNFRGLDGLDVETAADISLSYANGVTANCHLNFFEKIPKRSYRFVLDNGSVDIDYLENRMTISPAGKTAEIVTLPDFERNTMFEAQLLHFFSRINLGNQQSSSLQYLSESKTILDICS